jgi:hypothetical protein
MTAIPDIPAHLAGRPRSGGLVVPWITPATPGGLYLFGKVTDLAQYQCLTRNLCQVCGQPLGRRAVLFARESDLGYQCTAEPAVCLPCAAYSSRACPMLAGRRSWYRASEHPALAGIPPAADQLLRQAAPAELWYTVWVRDYDVIEHRPSPARSPHRGSESRRCASGPSRPPPDGTTLVPVRCPAPSVGTSRFFARAATTLAVRQQRIPQHDTTPRGTGVWTASAASAKPTPKRASMKEKTRNGQPCGDQWTVRRLTHRATLRHRRASSSPR